MMVAKAGWVIRYAADVVKKDIPALDGTIKLRIRKVIESKLAVDPLRFGKPLRYSLNHLRCLRIGDYRVLYYADHEQGIISITAIGHRRDIYE
jgi:mRNA interferase RelE/StbE